MIESREEEALLVQHRQLVRELNDYRKVAAHLKKELRFKDSKHSRVHRKTEDLLKENNQYEHIDLKNQKKIISSHQIQPVFKKQIFSESLAREKSHPSHFINPEQNFFKNGSSFNVKKKNRQQLKLPSLEKKSIFHEEDDDKEEDLKPKVLKISKDKLIKLRHEDVKKKFESRFKMTQSIPS